MIDKALFNKIQSVNRTRVNRKAEELLKQEEQKISDGILHVLQLMLWGLHHQDVEVRGGGNLNPWELRYVLEEQIYRLSENKRPRRVMNLLEIDPQEFSEFKSALSAAEYLIENLVDLLTEKGILFPQTE